MVLREALTTLLLLSVINVSLSTRDPWLYCDTCLAVISEIANIMSIQRDKNVQVGGFRIDRDEKKVDYKTSEIYLHEVVDIVCAAMYQYGIYTNPDTQKKHLVRANPFQGHHAPATKKHIKTGADVSNGVTYACLTILEEHEDMIIEFFKRKKSQTDDMSTKFCVRYAKLCTKQDVESQLWALAEAVTMGVGGDINAPSQEADPIMDNIEVEVVDLTNEPLPQGWKSPGYAKEEEEVKEWLTEMEKDLAAEAGKLNETAVAGEKEEL